MSLGWLFYIQRQSIRKQLILSSGVIFWILEAYHCPSSPNHLPLTQQKASKSDLKKNLHFPLPSRWAILTPHISTFLQVTRIYCSNCNYCRKRLGKYALHRNCPSWEHDVPQWWRGKWQRVNFNCNSSIILQQLHLKSTTEIDNYIVTHCYYMILDNTVVKLLLKFLFS